jgi:putative endonuclease
MNKSNKNKIFGNYGESLAARYLARNGFVIVEENFRCFSGEIDIIAKKEDLLIIVEVKSRKHIDSDEALLSITKSKQRKISRATADFIDKNQQYSDNFIRFDIITVIKHPYFDEYSINHYEDAFSYIADER